MKNVKVFILILSAIFSSTTIANSEKYEITGYLVLSKMAGACNFVDRLSNWQLITNNSKSLSDKLVRYESARLGYEQGSFQKCN